MGGLGVACLVGTLAGCDDGGADDAAAGAGGADASAGGASGGGAGGGVGGAGGGAGTLDAGGGTPDAGTVDLDAGDLDAGPEPDGGQPDAAAPVSMDAIPLPSDFDPPPCPAPPDGEAPPAGRWSLSVFHFNVQYVAGGLEGWVEATTGSEIPNPDIEISAEAVEDRIVTESFEPLLGILERNPDLALTFEMQGLMVDVMRERHPEILNRLRDLAEAGQAELASIHWSDQFFIAFGREDMDESWRRTRESFRLADLPLSRVVFAQEGQNGEGFGAWLAEVRPDAINVVARNLPTWFQNDLPSRPYWNLRGGDAILPRGMQDEVVHRSFNFFDDGEVLASASSTPYLGNYFREVPRAVKAYEHELRCLADNGFTVGRIGDYLDAVKATGYEPEPMPGFLDGTWQPRSTQGPSRWAGAGGLFKKHERDNTVLTTCIRARHQVLALQTVGPHPDVQTRKSVAEALDEAWSALLLGQVSDARGINPWWGEIRYGLENCARAASAARQGLHAWGGRGGLFRVDTQFGAVVQGARPPAPARVEVQAPIGVVISEDGRRGPTMAWTVEEGADPAAADTVFRLEIEWPPEAGSIERHADCVERRGGGPLCDQNSAVIEATFPRAAGSMGVRTALVDIGDRYTEADFTFHPDAFRDAIWVVTSDGYLELGEGVGYLVKDIRTVHLAYALGIGEGNNTTVRVRDETQQAREPTTWAFWFTRDREAALRLADRNLNPVVTVDVR